MYPALRDPHHWTLHEVLAHQAAARGGQVFLHFPDEGRRVTYAEARAAAAAGAAALAAYGVEPGERVAVMLPNGWDFLRLWLAAAWRGAVLVPFNTALVGDFLTHVLTDSAPRLVIGDEASLPRLAPSLPSGTRLLTPAAIAERGEDPAPHPRRHAEIACIMYTSGTTGPSKGVLMPEAHCFLFGLGTLDTQELGPADRHYVTMPLFHVNALMMQVYAVLIAGAEAVVRRRFSASAFVDDLHRFGITAFNLLGAASAFVFAQPPRPADRGHSVRVIQVAPNPEEHERIWRTRFGIPVVLSGFGMTECNIAVYSRRHAHRPGTCGKVYDPYFEVEIRDPETDDPLPPGKVGEIMVRPKVPFGFMAGYHRLPEATLEAWRNFWFHTGDAGVADAEGYITFIDRLKDCIRRRGENISSFEVENALRKLPGVREVAAFGVPSDIAGAEEEVMLAIVPDPAAGLTPALVRDHARRHLPRFAEPRYVEFVTELPKTPTEKVRKSLLRARGVGPATIDLSRLPA
jgi:crotonobetaine/carnitine-CoA ligase